MDRLHYVWRPNVYQWYCPQGQDEKCSHCVCKNIQEGVFTLVFIQMAAHQDYNMKYIAYFYDCDTPGKGDNTWWILNLQEVGIILLYKEWLEIYCAHHTDNVHLHIVHLVMCCKGIYLTEKRMGYYPLTHATSYVKSFFTMSLSLSSWVCLYLGLLPFSTTVHAGIFAIAIEVGSFTYHWDRNVLKTQSYVIE